MASVIDTGELHALDLFAEAWPYNFPPQVVDVGANAGDYIAEVFERFPQAHVLAFEPQLGGRRRLDARFRTAADRALAVLRYGLSSRPAAAELHSSSSDSCVLATLYERPDAGGYHGGEVQLDHSEQIELRTLDEFAPMHTDWLKIDVEGHELAVLRGANDALANTDVVQFEYNDCAAVAEVRFADLAAFLTERSFELWLEHTDWLEQVADTGIYEREFGNYLAVRSECAWFHPEHY